MTSHHVISLADTEYLSATGVWRGTALDPYSLEQAVGHERR
jgi:hypothetical protein